MIKINKTKASRLKKSSSMPTNITELIVKVQSQEMIIHNLIKRIEALESLLQI